jgi:hypothetical protein
VTVEEEGETEVFLETGNVARVGGYEICELQRNAGTEKKVRENEE